MHVLNPYTATGINSPARGRYSTFMFSGVNLESGGAPLEYGDALSAVLPLETKDKSPINKLGINASTVGFGGGGTRAFDKGSLSVNRIIRTYVSMIISIQDVRILKIPTG